jgi:hypothetical protein
MDVGLTNVAKEEENKFCLFEHERCKYFYKIYYREGGIREDLELALVDVCIIIGMSLGVHRELEMKKLDDLTRHIIWHVPQLARRYCRCPRIEILRANCQPISSEEERRTIIGCSKLSENELIVHCVARDGHYMLDLHIRLCGDWREKYTSCL